MLCVLFDRFDLHEKGYSLEMRIKRVDMMIRAEGAFRCELRARQYALVDRLGKHVEKLKATAAAADAAAKAIIAPAASTSPSASTGAVGASGAGPAADGTTGTANTSLGTSAAGTLSSSGGATAKAKRTRACKPSWAEVVAYMNGCKINNVSLSLTDPMATLSLRDLAHAHAMESEAFIAAFNEQCRAYFRFSRCETCCFWSLHVPSKSVKKAKKA